MKDERSILTRELTSQPQENLKNGEIELVCSILTPEQITEVLKQIKTMQTRVKGALLEDAIHHGRGIPFYMEKINNITRVLDSL